MSGILNVMLAGKAGATAYQGPIDIQSGVYSWAGLRAGSLARIGSPAVNLIRSSDSATGDIGVTSDGHLNTADAFFNGSTYKVVKLYDQSGNGNDFGQITDANRPTLVLSVLGSYPVIRFAGSQWIENGTMTASSQPNWLSAVVNNPTSSGTEGYLGDGPTGNNSIGVNAANTAATYAGVTQTATAADNTWHAIQTVMNGASSDIYVDGTSNIGDAGTQGMITQLKIGRDGYSNYYIGDLMEIGYWNGLNPSSGQKSAMNSNQHTFWGF